jgi:hypothetical protein
MSKARASHGIRASGQDVHELVRSGIRERTTQTQQAGEGTSDAQGGLTIEAVEGRQVSVRARIVARGGGASDEVRIAGESGDSAVTLKLSQTGQLPR